MSPELSPEPVRAPADWLALREPADAVARSTELVALLAEHLATGAGLLVHDLGCGTGSMARWLAPRLPRHQHWVLHDRDGDLLQRVAAHPPPLAADRSQVTVATRQDDVTTLPAGTLADASLVTASALLDMMTRPELERFIALCVAPGCPVLVALTVTGVVRLDPPDPLDDVLAAAFNDHQRRRTGTSRRLGPDAVPAARELLELHGREVVVRPSPWHLGPDLPALRRAWFDGWLRAAVEQEPALASPARGYARRHPTTAPGGGWTVTVEHQDLLVLPA